MLFLKYLCLVLIIVITTYIGFYKSKIFSNRVKNLKDVKSSLNIFKTKKTL